jgi:hypothetical protein
MTITWEALGVMVVLVVAVCGINVFATRAIVRQELVKFQNHIRPIGECDLLHNIINRRLDKIEGEA